jgi:tRNA(Ile)-lysidine synthase
MQNRIIELNKNPVEVLGFYWYKPPCPLDRCVNIQEPTWARNKYPEVTIFTRGDDFYKMAGKQSKRMSLMSSVYGTVQDHAMLTPGDSVLVGVSGGPDSVALLRILSALADKLSIKIAVAHLNHCLRGKESDRDEAFVRELASTHGLPLHVQQKNVTAWARENKKSIEEAARDVRYAFYREVASQHGFNRIALGHNYDDNAEQVLMNLLRGSGPRGLAGIPPTRDNWIIRPLIQTSRQEILAFLTHCHQPFVLDSSNLDTRFLRNKIRHELLPYLIEEYNPGVKASLNRLSDILTKEEAWMEEETLAIVAGHLERMGKRENRLSRKLFSSMHCALARRVVRRAIREVKGDLKRITLGHIDDILDLIASDTGGKNLDLPHRIRITLTKGWVYFTRSALPLRELSPLTPDKGATFRKNT